MKSKFKDEVAIVIGLVVSVVALVQDEIANGNTTWRSLLPVVAAFVVRRYTTSSASAADQVARAEAQVEAANKKLDEFQKGWEEFLEALKERKDAVPPNVS